MSKCLNCGSEVEIGAKFCAECGAPVPKQTESEGFSIGDKNVIAGDVHNVKNVNTVNNVSNTVIDETKKVVLCAVCGKHTANVDAHRCPSCGQMVCETHFDAQRNLCRSCLSEIHQQAVSKYRALLAEVYADGKITADERAQLETMQKNLGINAEEAAALEKEFHRQNLNLTVSEKVAMEDAAALLLQNNINDAYLKVSRIYLNHPKEEIVLSLYLRILKRYDPKEALKNIDGLNVDFRESYLAAIDIFLQDGLLDEAERRINMAKQIWPSDLLIRCAEIRHLCALAYKTGKPELLNGVEDIFNSIPQPCNDYEKGALLCAKAMFNAASENSSDAIDNLQTSPYWVETAKDLFALSPEERERLERERLEKERLERLEQERLEKERAEREREEQERKRQEEERLKQEKAEAEERELRERERALQEKKAKMEEQRRALEIENRLRSEREKQDLMTELLRQRTPEANTSSKNKMVALMLSVFLGWIGIDRFYLGYAGSGIAKMCTFGGLRIWWLIDILLIAAGSLKPSDGNWSN